MHEPMNCLVMRRSVTLKVHRGVTPEQRRRRRRRRREGAQLRSGNDPCRNKKEEVTET